jgi:hypothetical protein
MKASVKSLEELEEVWESGEAGKSDLEESEMTLQTETGSTSEEEGSTGWFGGMGADFRVLATSIKDTAGGVASFVHRSALTVAAEIASLELEKSEGENEGEPLRLPWEIRIDESTYEQDSILRDKIIGLSCNESTFLQPFSLPKISGANNDQEEEGDFILDESRIQLIRHLLDLDENLAATHARLSGRSDVREIRFWKNYFYHCYQAREEHVRQFKPNLDIVGGDDMSFVCVGSSIASAPTSLNSGIFQSEDDLVIVGAVVDSPKRP